MTTDQKPDALPVVAWKCGNEFAPYHPQASHINPDHRDGWNACYRGAQASLLAKEADTDRLDWMDKNPGRIKHSIGYRDSRDSWVWTDGNGYGHDAVNLRAAIDAARAAADQGGSMSTLREDFEAWALQERYAERNAHGLWFANNVHEFSLWKGYQAATERAAKLCDEIKDACDRADEDGDLVMTSTAIGAEACAKVIRGTGGQA